MALLLDGGGLGGGVVAELVFQRELAPRLAALSLYRRAHTTIPDPSSVEEEGRRVP